MKDELKNSTMLMKSFEDIYGKETKIPKKRLQELLKSEVSLDSQECLKYGIVEQII